MIQDLFTVTGIPELKPGKLIDQSPNQKVLALTWKQPYCSLMLPPYNKIETRTWETKYRGWVLMCAALTSYKTEQIVNISGVTHAPRIWERINDAEAHKLRGHAIAIGRLADCRPMRIEDSGPCYVSFNPKLFCHIYEDVHPIEPIRWKGKQGWATVQPEILSQVVITA